MNPCAIHIYNSPWRELLICRPPTRLSVLDQVLGPKGLVTYEVHDNDVGSLSRSTYSSAPLPAPYQKIRRKRLTSQHACSHPPILRTGVIWRPQLPLIFITSPFALPLTISLTLPSSSGIALTISSASKSLKPANASLFPFKYILFLCTDSTISRV